MSLKRELENPASPLRVTLEEALPDLGRHARSTWNPQMKGAVARFNPDLPPDVLGHAISERIAWQFTGTGGQLHGANVLEMAGAHPDVLDGLVAAMLDPCPSVDADREARIACLVGLADRSMRTGLTQEPWYEPLLTANTLDDALDAVDSALVDDVISTTTTALSALSPLAENSPIVRAPTFAGSGAVRGADADLILGRALLEVKAVRSASLAKRDLQQVITYSLLDWDDQYELDEAAMLAARHGVLVRWPLEELVAVASRGVYDLVGVRAHLKDSLTSAARVPLRR